MYPAYQIMFASSLEAKTHYGPCFVSKVEFSVNGQGQLSPVEINISFVGGKSVTSPVMNVKSPDVTKQNNGTDFRYYRTSSLIDCLAYNGIYTNVDDFKKSMASVVNSEIFDPQIRLISMSLKMEQNVDLAVTVPNKTRTDADGPHYASISDRTVTGEFKYYSLSGNGNPLGLYIDNETNSISISNLNDTATVSMYFGGPFLFAIPNVQFQKQISNIQAGKGYLHTYNFIARSAVKSTAGVNSTPFLNSGPSSEFIINDYVQG